MNAFYFKSLIIIILTSSLVSCKKAGPGSTDNTNNNNNNGNTPVAAADSGYVVVYTNDYIYSDPAKGAIAVDKIGVNINGINKGNIQTTAVTGNKIYYKLPNALSLKLPIGAIVVKGNTSSGASRTQTVNVVKNDTLRVKVDFSYNDPNANSYYIQYNDNGVAKKVTSLSSWAFYANNHQSAIGTVPGCAAMTGSYNYDGPTFISPIVSVPSANVIIRFLRLSWNLKPDAKAYNYHGGTLDVSFTGAVVNCSKSDSYATINVSEVKIVEDMGLEKRGYYAGTFDAVVYYTATFGAVPEKHVISNGKFQAPISGIKFN